MRPISAAGIQALCRETSDQVWVSCLTITGAGLSEPARLTNNPAGLTVGPYVFAYYPFEFQLARDTDDAPTQAQIRIDNIDRYMSLAILNAAGRPTLDVEVYRVPPGGAPVLETGPDRYTGLSVTGDASTVTITLGFNLDILNEAAVHDGFSPGLAPGLF